MPAILQLAGVVAGYGAGDILKGVDLDVDGGTITCLIGPNGAGKSTVLKTVSGLLRPKRGTVTFQGQEMSRLTTKARLTSSTAVRRRRTTGPNSAPRSCPRGSR